MQAHQINPHPKTLNFTQPNPQPQNNKVEQHNTYNNPQKKKKKDPLIQHKIHHYES